jgi:hypothetical protein
MRARRVGAHCVLLRSSLTPSMCAVAVEIVVQGIAPPLCTSVAWLGTGGARVCCGVIMSCAHVTAHHLAAPDGFVYLVVRDTY